MGGSSGRTGRIPAWLGAVLGEGALDRLRTVLPGEFGDPADRLPPALEGELSRALHLLIRLRLFSLWVSFCVLLMFLVWEPTPWRVGVCVVAMVFHALSTLRDLRRRSDGSISAARFVGVLTVNQIVFTLLAVVTGGIESPLLIGFVPVSVLLAVAVGHVRPFLISLLPPLAVVWILAAGRYFGPIPELVPEMFRPAGPTEPLILHTLLVGLVLSFAMLVGGLIALMLRQALDQAVLAAHRSRQEALTAMRERNTQLVQVSEAVAHELKNPLASIRGLAGLVRRRTDPDTKQAKQVEVMIQEIDRMGEILHELFTFSRPYDRLKLEAVQPARLLEELVIQGQGMAEGRGITVEGAADADRPLFCDPARVKQLLSNLVQNAVDATPQGGVVRLSATQRTGDAEGPRPDGLGDRRFVIFEVEDTGSGVDDDVRGRLFTRGATTKIAGSGLGLVIARSIAERHGGTLALEAGQEGGCRAVLVLPSHPSA